MSETITKSEKSSQIEDDGNPVSPLPNPAESSLDNKHKKSEGGRLQFYLGMKTLLWLDSFYSVCSLPLSSYLLPNAAIPISNFSVVSSGFKRLEDSSYKTLKLLTLFL